MINGVITVNTVEQTLGLQTGDEGPEHLISDYETESSSGGEEFLERLIVSPTETRQISR